MYAIHINDDELNYVGRILRPSTLPAIFNTLRFTNYCWYLKADETPGILKAWDRRQANFQLLRELFSESSSDMKQRDIMYAGQ